MNKYRDLFTESSPSRFNLNFSELFDLRDDSLQTKIANPLNKYSKLDLLFKDIIKNQLVGNDHIFYTQLIKEHCSSQNDIYCQILLALEVAQREFSFTHFDLHCQNIIVRKVICK